MKEERIRFRRSVGYTITFIGLLWFIKLSENYLEADFGNYGILPRTLEGSLGIFLAPLIHGDIYHLISNSFPLLFLGILLFYFYDKIALNVVLLIYLMTGIWVWVVARDAYHIGASGVVYGLLTFLLFSGFFRRDRNTLAISFIILVLYGGSFFSGFIPNKMGISWESHLMGGMAGLLCAFYFKPSKSSKVKSDAQDVFNYNYEYKSDHDNKSKSYTYTFHSPSEEDENTSD